MRIVHARAASGNGGKTGKLTTEFTENTEKDGKSKEERAAGGFFCVLLAGASAKAGNFVREEVSLGRKGMAVYAPRWYEAL
jgi:hypothetical protein